MMRLHSQIALAFLCAILSGSTAMAQEDVKAVLVELKARGNADTPMLTECDFVCKYRNETWTIHSRSSRAHQTPPGGLPEAPAYGIKAESAEGLNVLFPTGAFMAIASRLDPVTLLWGYQDGTLHLLPPAKLDGVECKILEADSLPLQMHVGTSYPAPAIDKATVSFYVVNGRVMRIVAQVTRKPTPSGPDTPLVIEATPHYRRAKTGAERQPGAHAPAQFVLNGNHQMVNDFAWSPDGKIIACLTFSSGCRMLSVDSGKELGTIPVSQGKRDVRFTPDGKYLVMPDQQAERILYLDASTGKESKSMAIGPCNLLVLSPDLSKALAWDRRNSRNQPRVVECFTGRTLCEMPTVKSSDVQFSADGKLLAALNGNRIDIKDTATGHDLRSFPSRCEQSNDLVRNRAWRMAFSPDSRLLAIGDASQGVSLYQLFDEEEHEPVRVYIYEVETGKLVQTLTGFNGAVKALQFSPDGSILAVGDTDDRGEAPGENAAVLFWETKSWKSLGATAVQPQSAIAHMQFSPDGKALATTAERSPSIEIWTLPHL